MESLALRRIAKLALLTSGLPQTVKAKMQWVVELSPYPMLLLDHPFASLTSDTESTEKSN